MELSDMNKSCFFAIKKRHNTLLKTNRICVEYTVDTKENRKGSSGENCFWNIVVRINVSKTCELIINIKFIFFEYSGSSNKKLQKFFIIK